MLSCEGHQKAVPSLLWERRVLTTPLLFPAVGVWYEFITAQVTGSYTGSFIVTFLYIYVL
jgi:hypothetical protein